jgi:uncharacterized membrane protein YkvA (DUF1232 family)
MKRLIAIKSMMKDPNVKRRKKLLVLLGIFYVFMPFDLIPTVIFPVGFLDDLILWLWILYHLRETLDTYWLGEKTVDLSKEYRGKTIINDVDYEVKEEYSKAKEKE